MMQRVAEGQLRITNPKHLNHFSNEKVEIKPEEKNVEHSFASLFSQALRKAQSTEDKSLQLQESLAVDPEHTSVEDVVLAQTETELAMTMTKTVVDRFVSAWKELENMRF